MVDAVELSPETSQKAPSDRPSLGSGKVSPKFQAEIKKISWRQALELRDKALYGENSQAMAHEQDDELALHYGAFLSGELISVASVYLEPGKAKLKKFATLKPYRQTDVGKRLFDSILQELRGCGIDQLYTEVRVKALSFYRSFGLKLVKPVKHEGVVYYLMAINF